MAAPKLNLHPGDVLGTLRKHVPVEVLETYLELLSTAYEVPVVLADRTDDFYTFAVAASEPTRTGPVSVRVDGVPDAGRR